jgi:hypothetical protein
MMEARYILVRASVLVQERLTTLVVSKMFVLYKAS